MTNYKKGIRFEFRVRDLFRKFGYEAERKAASSPYDIIVMKNGSIKFIVDAKKTSQKDKKRIYIRRDDVEKLIKEAKKLNTRPLFVYGFYRSPIYVEFPERLLEKDVIGVDGKIKLEDFLKSIQRTNRA